MGDPCHGWSATPAKDLTRYLLGVTPAEPGFTTARVAPRPGRLEVVHGAAPTPHGLVHVQAANGAVEIRSPVPVALVALDGSTTRLPPGAHARVLETAAPRE